MDADRREFLQQFSGRKLIRLMGATVYAGLEAVTEMRRATAPSLEGAGMALRQRKRRTAPDVEDPPLQGARTRQAPD
jgi:hypothetical protein